MHCPLEANQKAKWSITQSPLLMWENCMASSVTRFGEISLLGENLKSFGHFLSIDLVFGKIVNLLWQIFIVLNGQIFN